MVTAVPAPPLSPGQKLLAQTMTEDELLSSVLDLAQRNGWLRAHFRPAQTKKGWRTAVQGDGKGFPDLILLRGDRLLVIELKSEGGTVKPEQAAWLAAFGAAGAECWVFRPRHWISGRIDEVLA